MTERERVNYAIKLVVSHALYYVGALQLWQTIAMRRKAVVLMYHRVLTADEQARTGSHPGLIVSQETFARQMAVLKRRFRVLSVEEFADCVARNTPFPDSSCLITFDDGWVDNFTNALPVLQRHGMPALIFLPVNFIGRQRLFARETMSHLLVSTVRRVREAPSERGRFAALLAPAGLAGVLDVHDANPRDAVIRAMGDQSLPPVMAKLVPVLADALGIRLDALTGEDGFMSWDQVAAMSKAGVAFGGHGAEHVLLNTVPDGEARDDIRISREVLDARVREAVPTFSYPNGNWTPAIADIVKQTGFRLAFTTQPGVVASSDAPFSLRRLNIHEGATSSAPMFLAKVVGLF